MKEKEIKAEPASEEATESREDNSEEDKENTTQASTQATITPDAEPESQPVIDRFELLHHLFKFVRTTEQPLNAVLAGYFAKLVTLLINRQQKQILPFVF